MEESKTSGAQAAPFFEQNHVQRATIKVGPGIPFGMERVTNAALKLGGVYGTWGECYNNQNLPVLLEKRLGGPLPADKRLSLADLGFTARHHIADLTPEQHVQVEVEVGARMLREAAQACGWDPSEVEGVLIGMSAPASPDYVDLICDAAGISRQALKVTIHKACDSSVGGLHLALNPDLPENAHLKQNIARSLYGKKVLVGGIEGLSRFVGSSHDINALQLFGNAAGIIGLIPGQSMKFLVGKTFEHFDDEGVLQVQMYYPHSGRHAGVPSLVEVTQINDNHVRIAGLMHEPADGSSVNMAGPMGMVKLFVRTGVEVVLEVYKAYQARLAELGETGKSISVAIVHHANYKINKLVEKHLKNEGVVLSMPWLLSEFGNVSAASNMIAFLRQLPLMKPMDHVLIDGFGAGTYYDTLAVELGG